MFTPDALAGYTSTALFAIINLLVTYFVLKRFLFKPIMRVLRTRQESLERQLKESATKQEEATRQMAEANRRIQQSTREGSEIVAAARSQADVQSESILTGARQEAAALVTRADSEIARMRMAIINDVRDEVADLSVAIASKVIGQAIDQNQQRKLVDQFLDDHLENRQPNAAASFELNAAASSVPNTAASSGPNAAATGTGGAGLPAEPEKR